MRFAIYSDVHGNLEALEAVLEHCDKHQADFTVCLGDVVGYGAEPVACIDRVRQTTAFVLAGNHDWAASGKERTDNFSTSARLAIRWTVDRLQETDLHYLCGLPLTVEQEDAFFVHASPDQPAQWPYLGSTSEGRTALSAAPLGMTFVGHSHRAFICSQSDATRVVGEGEADLTGDDRYLVNVGSVGQPRDGDPRASVCIWDIEAATLSLDRVAYDIASAQSKIRAARLPAMCADRLEYGN